ncbi:MAG TPA: M13 family metallopeptidase [Pyrinomonadaceae bacterium]|nr:M13 family metallopeptidase [Pyrinomonadaceae bacterium]
MKVFKTFVSLLLAATFGVTAIVGQSSHFDIAGMDTKTSACADFYQYANGGWLMANPIPAAYPAWGVANVLDEKNREALHQILEEAAKNTTARKGSNEQKVGDYYAACVDEAKIETDGLKTIQAELDLIAKIKDQAALQKEIAHLHSIGINAAFGSGSNQDFKNSAEVTAGLFQGGLGLPNRDYYFKSDDKSKTIRDEYLKHVAKMFELMGDDPAKAAAEAQAIMKLETKLAEGSKTPVELRDPEQNYHRMRMAQLSEVAPAIDWVAYFQGTGLMQKPDVNVGQPEFFKALNTQMTATPIADWQTYLRWNLINGTASALSKQFVDEDFHFKGTILQGSKENLPRWRRCVTATDRAMGEALGAVYVQKAFPPAAKARALEMVRNLEAALKSDISTLNWMGEATRKQAIVKLEAFLNKIGYPDKWRDYSTLTIDRGSYVANRLRVAKFNEERDWNKIGKPVDRMEWLMSPPTVNAYYNPQINEIVFPAGILQPPYFDATADDALNYGAMGSVIGHEMTHGFDDEGRQFDSTGNLANWWSDADLKAFNERAECIVKQFNGFEVEKGLFENGKLVQGESIADLGGLVVAYAAFQKSMEGKPRPANIDGFTPEQRFFLGFARGWAENIRPELARLLVNSDPHPLAKFRVNGPLSNMPQFAAAFQCKDGEVMVRPEKDRCVIW